MSNNKQIEEGDIVSGGSIISVDGWTYDYIFISNRIQPIIGVQKVIGMTLEKHKRLMDEYHKRYFEDVVKSDAIIEEKEKEIADLKAEIARLEVEKLKPLRVMDEGTGPYSGLTKETESKEGMG